MQRQCLQVGLIRAKTVSSWAPAKFSLADKMVDGEKVVSLNERFGSRLANIKNNPIAEKALHRRLEQAWQIKRKAEKLLERSLEEIQTEDLTSILKEWKG